MSKTFPFFPLPLSQSFSDAKIFFQVIHWRVEACIMQSFICLPGGDCWGAVIPSEEIAEAGHRPQAALLAGTFCHRGVSQLQTQWICREGEVTNSMVTTSAVQLYVYGMLSLMCPRPLDTIGSLSNRWSYGFAFGAVSSSVLLLFSERYIPFTVPAWARGTPSIFWVYQMLSYIHA